jgi:hypothetical protein
MVFFDGRGFVFLSWYNIRGRQQEYAVFSFSRDGRGRQEVESIDA